MKNLVLTLAANYSLTEIEPFLSSWYEHATGSTLLLFTKNCDSSVHAACRALGVDTEELTGEWEHSLLIDRHFIYRDYLRDNGRWFGEVLITDSRDVVFQSDPFQVPRDRDVWFAAEDKIISDCWFNNFWMTNVYGEDVAKKVRSETISCAGTTIGACGGILQYLELMCSELEQHSAAALICGDQACHNYIYYVMRPDFIMLDRADRIAHTLSHTPDDRISIVGDRVLVDGAVAPVVHQWDRHPKLVRYINHRYRLRGLDIGPETQSPAWRAALQRWLRRRRPFAGGRSGSPA